MIRVVGGINKVTGALEYSVLRVHKIYAWENTVFYIAVHGPYKP